MLLLSMLDATGIILSVTLSALFGGFVVGFLAVIGATTSRIGERGSQTTHPCALLYVYKYLLMVQGTSDEIKNAHVLLCIKLELSESFLEEQSEAHRIDDQSDAPTKSTSDTFAVPYRQSSNESSYSSVEQTPTPCSV
jgi:hypothetical protein